MFTVHSTPRTFIVAICLAVYFIGVAQAKNVRLSGTRFDEISNVKQIGRQKLSEISLGDGLWRLEKDSFRDTKIKNSRRYGNIDADSIKHDLANPNTFPGLPGNLLAEKKVSTEFFQENQEAIEGEKSKPSLIEGKLRERRSADITPQGENQVVIFSEWESWMQCDAACEANGNQVRTRTCYSNQHLPLARLSCNYDNLVDSRPCVGFPCPTDNDSEATSTYRYTKWSQWSPCSVTCGKGGQQMRTRNCKSSSSSPAEFIMAECSELAQELRPCQYSTSCATWDDWSSWSSCSETCGIGVNFRSRNCIVHRYFALKTESAGNKTDDFRDEDNQNHSSDVSVSHQQLNGIKETANQIKLSVNASEKQDNQRGILFVNAAQNTVFVVDVMVPQNYNGAPVDLNGSDLYEEVTETVSVRTSICERNGETYEEHSPCGGSKMCNSSEWSSWRTWSACSSTCGAGISKKERRCLRHHGSAPCQGRKFLYRRCYQPPCWTSWAEGACSATCGPGYKQRTRRCIQSTLAQHFGTCPGHNTEMQKCYLKSCFGGSWGMWSEFGLCSVSCNGGFKHRNRTCDGIVCFGKGHELVQCNKQRCPTWNRWSPFSCCNVSCGRGHRERSRTCNGGRVGEEGCDGSTWDVEYCYRKPCGEDQISTSLSSSQCGSRMRKNTVQLRIFGGKESIPHGWPWQASWQHRVDKGAKWKHFCGGTLVHPRWVITAGHCIEEAPFAVNRDDPGRAWSVVLGMNKLYKDGMRFNAERIIVHPDYEHSTVTNSDIAMIKLRRMVEITDNISPACMSGTMEPKPGEKCVITGWGFTAPGGNHSESLLEASVPIVDFNECLNYGTYYRYFLRKGIHMCAGDPDHTELGYVPADSCTGDSGGPLVCKNDSDWYVAGVTSFGFADCGTPNHVGIYTPVKTFEEWIRKNVEKLTYDKC